MIRRLTVADLVNLLRLGLLWRSNLAVTRQRVGGGTLGVRWLANNLRPDLNWQASRAVWAGLTERSVTGVAAARRRCGPKAWEIEYLAYQPFAAETAVELLEAAGSHVARCGTERLFLRVASDSSLDSVAQHAGFTPSFQEHLYVRGRRPTGVGPSGDELLREAGPGDEHGLFQLYNASTPAEVRAARGVTLSQWQDSREASAGPVTELVWVSGDSLLGSARYTRSLGSVHLEMIAVAETGQGLGGFIDTVLAKLGSKRQVYCLVPDYHSELGRALELRSFDRGDGYQVWVKAIASPVIEPGLAPARA